MQGRIFKIQRHALHDGPGIRTLVFFKGCPLRCLWCFNPESHAPGPQVMHQPAKCLGCGACLEACPRPGSLTGVPPKLRIEQGLCDGCGICAENCPAGALGLSGESLGLDQIMAEVLKDTVFYRRSGGGVTLSGGEVTMQAEFAAALLQECRSQGIHTAMETSGHCSWPDLQGILRHTDLLLYDLKAFTPSLHAELTGVDNRRILENAALAARSGASMIIRIPLIPGCNDAPEELRGIAGFIKERLPMVSEVHLLPYELIGVAKYERLGKPYSLEKAEPPGPEQIERAKGYFEDQGLQVRLKG